MGIVTLLHARSICRCNAALAIGKKGRICIWDHLQLRGGCGRGMYPWSAEALAYLYLKNAKMAFPLYIHWLLWCGVNLPQHQKYTVWILGATCVFLLLISEIIIIDQDLPQGWAKTIFRGRIAPCIPLKKPIRWPLRSCKVCPFTAVFTMLHSTCMDVATYGKYRVGAAGGKRSELLLVTIYYGDRTYNYYCP